MLLRLRPPKHLDHLFEVEWPVIVLAATSLGAIPEGNQLNVQVRETIGPVDSVFDGHVALALTCANFG